MNSGLKRFGPALATAGVLAGLGLTALPMARVWTTHGEFVPVSSPRGVGQTALSTVPTQSEIVVDLRDNATDADIAAIEREYNVDLKYNSVEGRDDKVMVAQLPVQYAVGAAPDPNLLDKLRHDSRVEAAEPDFVYSIPETPGAYQVNAGNGGFPLRNWQQMNVYTGTINGLSYEPAAQTVEVYRDETRVGTARWTFSRDEQSAWGAPVSVTVTASSSDPRSDLFNAVRTDRAPNDPRYNEQWNFRMIGAESAWKRTRGKGVVVAVIDTGVASATTKKGKLCRDFGQTEFVPGYDFVNKDADAYDDHGHGTHVAGTIAESTNNNEGVAGLTDAKIMPLKVLSAEGWGTSANIADAIRFAADKGANVINMSLGSSQPSSVIHNAVKYARKKGVTIVCAAGNGFGEPVGYPAAFPECIAVSSVGPSGEIATYSSYGKEVALAAPGGDMIESQNPADGILQNTNYPEKQGGKGDDYYAFQGTSMASPHVAAAAAMIYEQGVHDPARVRDLLTKSATPKNDANKYGAGVLNLANATAKAEQLNGVKLRSVLLWGLGFVAFAFVGYRRRFGLRTAMVGALGLGFFGADLWTNLVGADSAWNLLAFSALAPVVAYAALRRGPGVKVAGMLGVGTAMNLWANWHNDTLPFTTATFGSTPLLWTAANMAVALGVSYLAAATVAKYSRR